MHEMVLSGGFVIFYMGHEALFCLQTAAGPLNILSTCMKLHAFAGQISLLYVIPAKAGIQE
jgi:hypothetical protein